MTKMTEEQFRALPENERLGSVLYGTFYFASVHTPNLAAMRMFDAAPAFTVQLGLDDENVEKALAMGLRVKDPTERIPEKHVEIKRKLGRWDEGLKKAFGKPDKLGKEREINIEVVDAGQRTVPKSILIGNGSKGYVKFARYWYKPNGGGVGTSLYKVRIIDLVPYEGHQDPDLVSTSEGFNVNEFTGTASTPEDDVPFDVTKAAASGGSVTAAALFDD